VNERALLLKSLTASFCLSVLFSCGGENRPAGNESQKGATTSSETTVTTSSNIVAPPSPAPRQAPAAAQKTPNAGKPPASEPAALEDVKNAVDVVKSYYAAIAAHDFERAYKDWGESGPPNQTLDDFRRGFATTASVSVETGEPSRIEGAAGSRYIDIPVKIAARTTSNETQHFEGTYTLRRVVVDGASEAQRRWHIERASIRRAS
jgi:hypothetical protein